MAVCIMIVILTFCGRDQCQRTVFIGGFAVQVFGDSPDVILQGMYVLKSRSNHLHDITVTGFGLDKIGFIYMAAAEGSAGNGFAVQPEIA